MLGRPENSEAAPYCFTYITVRALAFIIAGHLAHHLAILRDRYF